MEAIKIKKKTVYVLRMRINESEAWGEPIYYTSKRQRDKNASFNRILLGMRTHSYKEKMPLDEIEEKCV